MTQLKQYLVASQDMDNGEFREFKTFRGALSFVEEIWYRSGTAVLIEKSKTFGKESYIIHTNLDFHQCDSWNEVEDFLRQECVHA